MHLFSQCLSIDCSPVWGSAAECHLQLLERQVYSMVRLCPDQSFLSLCRRRHVDGLCMLCLSCFETTPNVQLKDVLDVISLFLELDTWCGFEAAKTAPWTSRGLHHFGKFLEPSDEWADRGCCWILMRWHSWEFLAHHEWAPEICRAQIWIFKFQHFRCLSDILATRPKYSYCIFLKGLCSVSVCWILKNVLCSMACVFYRF